jgi:flagellar hook-associated protein 1 FlgK
MVNVFVGSGQGLVVGTNVTEMSIRADEFFPDRNAVVLGDPATGPNISSLLGDGALGGVLDFLDNVLTPNQLAFGRLAMGMADAFNQQHALGLDLNDEVGGDYFEVPQPKAFGSSSNTTTALPTLTLTDISALSTDEYLIKYDGAGNWTALNMSDDSVTPLVGPTVIDGVEVDVTAIGAVPGDSYRFILSATAEAARDIKLKIDDPSKIAAAGILRGGEAVDANGQPLVPNAGSASINEIVLSDNALYPLANDVSLVYDSAIPGFNVDIDGDAVADAVLNYDPATDSGQLVGPLTIGTTDIELRISGTPQDGDQFTLGNNTGAVSDNRNALSLGALGSAKVLIGGTSSLQQSYGQMIADVGAKTHQAEVTMEAQSTLLHQAEAEVSAVSGVNLDEEAANLLRFQQAYQANAQMISAADSLFQTLLDAVRR